MLIRYNFFPVHGQRAWRLGQDWFRERADLLADLSLEKLQGYRAIHQAPALTDWPSKETQTNRGLGKVLSEPAWFEKHQERNQTWSNICTRPVHVCPGLKIWILDKEFEDFFSSGIKVWGGRRRFARQEAELAVMYPGSLLLALSPSGNSVFYVFGASFILNFLNLFQAVSEVGGKKMHAPFLTFRSQALENPKSVHFPDRMTKGKLNSKRQNGMSKSTLQ